jgi:hypothetical protein
VVAPRREVEAHGAGRAKLLELILPLLLEVAASPDDVADMESYLHEPELSQRTDETGGHDQTVRV